MVFLLVCWAASKIDYEKSYSGKFFLIINSKRELSN
jgi:hypothetical protein